MSKKILACAVIVLALAVAYVLSFSLQYARAFGATGCMRLSEGDAVLYTAILMVVVGIGCGAVCSLIPRFKRHMWRVVAGSLVSTLTFLVGLLWMLLMLKWLG